MIKAYNYALALSALSWAALRVYKIPSEEQWTLVNCSIIALHLQISFLFFFRTPISSRLQLRPLVIALLSLAAGGSILHLTPPLHTWPVVCSIAFLISTLFVLASFTFLGKSFAVFPVARDLVIRGPYSWVRHPAYLGEFGMLTASAAASVFDWPIYAILLLTLSLLAIAWRIVEEENILSASLDYQSYREQVRYRLIPFVW